MKKAQEDVDDFEARLDELRAFHPLTEDNAEAFIDAVADLTDTNDRRVVQPVLLMADDELPLGGINDHMLSLLESVPTDIFVEELLAVLPEFAAQNPFSAKTEVSKLLWSDAARSVLISKLSSLEPRQVDALKSILRRFKVPRLVGPIEEVAAALP